MSSIISLGRLALMAKKEFGASEVSGNLLPSSLRSSLSNSQAD